ncbi:MAG: glycosyltransferase family 4 protein [Haloarculaceae archaeon]
MPPGDDLRVLQVTTSERPFFSQQVRALEARGVDCHTLTVPEPGGRRGPGAYLRFYAALLGEGLGDYDLVHANYGLIGPLALSQPIRPVVVTIWGSELLGGSAWLDRWSRVAARRADAVVVPSAVLSRELDVANETIPFGVDTDRFRPIDRAAARARVGWDDGPNVLFPYDPDRPVKNYPLAGRVVDELQADATLRAVSGVDHAEMPYYMNASDAVLVTSRYESGPMVVKEAAACNVPVVSTPVGFVPEVLDGVSNSHVAASTTDLVDALDDVLGDGGRADGRDAVDALGVQQMGDRLLATYRRLVGE